MSGSCLANTNNNGFNLICLPTKGLKCFTCNISQIWLSTRVTWMLWTYRCTGYTLKILLQHVWSRAWEPFVVIVLGDSATWAGKTNTLLRDFIWFRKNILDYSNSLYISIYWDTEELIWRNQRSTPGFFLKSYKICSRLIWILILDLSFSSYKTFSKLLSFSFIKS